MEKVHFLDEDIEKRFSKERTGFLYRYVKLKYVGSKNLFFANPFNERAWKDPYERWFIGATYIIGDNTIEYKYKDRLLCLCLTARTHSEAAWYVYGTKKTRPVRLKVNLNKLVEILNRQEDFEVYIGKVKYITHSDMKRNSPPKSLCVDKDTFNTDDLAWIKLLFLKRNAFDYEQEIRIVLIPREKISSEEKGVKIKIDNISELYSEVCFLPYEDKDKNSEIEKRLETAGLENIKEEDLYLPIREDKVWDFNKIHYSKQEKN